MVKSPQDSNPLHGQAVHGRWAVGDPGDTPAFFRSERERICGAQPQQRCWGCAFDCTNVCELEVPENIRVMATHRHRNFEEKNRCKLRKYNNYINITYVFAMKYSDARLFVLHFCLDECERQIASCSSFMRSKWQGRSCHDVFCAARAAPFGWFLRRQSMPLTSHDTAMGSQARSTWWGKH